jgi:Flp pilus assembly protein TadG
MIRSRSAVPNRRRHRGQGLVEFSLVIVPFLLILFGIIDVGRLVYLNSTLSQAAREGARLGSVEAGWLPPAPQDSTCNLAGGAVCPPDVATLRTHITAAANRMMAPFGSVSQVYTSCDAASGSPTPPIGAWTTTTCAQHTNRDVISVRVTSTFTPITPLVGQLLGNLPVSGSATMSIN